MAGIVAAPQSGDGNAMGIAYKANLHTIKATRDVLLNTQEEISGVAEAIITATDNPSKIISMSLARINIT